MSLEEIRKLNVVKALRMSEDPEAPSKVNSIPRLKCVLVALRLLLVGERPYRVLVRVKRND